MFHSVDDDLAWLRATIGKARFSIAGIILGLILSGITGRPSLNPGWVWIKVGAGLLCYAFGLTMDMCRKVLDEEWDGQASAES